MCLSDTGLRLWHEFCRLAFAMFTFVWKEEGLFVKAFIVSALLALAVAVIVLIALIAPS